MKSLPISQRGIIHILPMGIILVLLVIVYLIWQGTIKLPGGLLQRGPKVELQETYKNPFDKETQYVNPFDKYKNPFVTNK